MTPGGREEFGSEGQPVRPKMLRVSSNPYIQVPEPRKNPKENPGRESPGIARGEGPKVGGGRGDDGSVTGGAGSP